MSTERFDETLHPRESTGRFATKTTVEADGGMGALCADEGQECSSCSDAVGTLSSDGLCDGCVAELERRAVGASPAVRAMDTIAFTLGQDDEWDSAGDYLTDVADTIAATGRPHPGDSTAERYAADLARWRAAYPRLTGPAHDERTLDAIALHLAGTSSWSADDLDEVAELVGSTGRPAPDTSTDSYREELRRWRVNEGYEAPTARDRLHTTCERAGLPVMHDVLCAAANRNRADDRLGSLTPDNVERMYTEEVGPAIDAVEHAVSDLARDTSRSRVRATRPDATYARTARDQGYPSVAAMLDVVRDRGVVPAAHLDQLSGGDIEDLHDELVAPVLDRLLGPRRAVREHTAPSTPPA